MKFISAKLQGGLGNQMFQIANAINYAFHYGAKYDFVLDAYTPMQARKPLVYRDNIYRNIPFSLNGEEEHLQITEGSLDFIDFESVLSSTNIVFDGYFQSDFYHRSIFNELKTFQFFDFPQETKIKLLDTFAIDDVFSTCLHIRRGDYLTISNILPVLDKSYFVEALKLLDVKEKNVLIISDDKQTSKQWFPEATVVENLEDYEEMLLMTMCKNKIISNSSFSWWGSFFGYSGGRVIAPSMWFGPDAPIPRCSIFRRDMYRISVLFNEGSLYAKPIS